MPAQSGVISPARVAARSPTRSPDLRATISGVADDNGTSISGGNPINIVNSDPNGQCYRRTFNQVLNIVYGGAGPGGGLFFPNGMNGTVKNSNDTFSAYTNIYV